MASVTQAKTKGGKMVSVLVLSESELPASLETRAYEAAQRAQAQGCVHWRIVDAGQRVMQMGRADAPVRTSEQAAAMSGPAEDRHDW